MKLRRYKKATHFGFVPVSIDMRIWLRNFMWWRQQMETFSVLLALCGGNSPVTCEFHPQKPLTWSFDVFFDLRLNKRLSKRSRRWWFGTLSCSLWRHRNGGKSTPCGIDSPHRWPVQTIAHKILSPWQFTPDSFQSKLYFPTWWLLV